MPAADGEQRPDEWPPAGLAARLAFLLKHVQAGFNAATEPALTDVEVDGRGYAVLTVLAGERPLSQHQAALRLAVDRTTMVALIDGLEAKGLVSRRPDPHDRRRNIVDVTTAGHAAMKRAGEAIEQAERRFLAPLGEAGARQFKDALLTLVSAPTPG